jgi:hypothetical protein
MCDHSLHNVKTRPAKVSDKLTTRNFDTGTRGFSASEDANVAVCILPGTELCFADEVRVPVVIRGRT